MISIAVTARFGRTPVKEKIDARMDAPRHLDIPGIGEPFATRWRLSLIPGVLAYRGSRLVNPLITCAGAITWSGSSLSASDSRITMDHDKIPLDSRIDFLPSFHGM